MPVVLRLCGCRCVGAIQQSCGVQNKRTEVYQSFPGQALKPGSSLSLTPSGRGGLGEMDGRTLLLVRIEVMRKSV